MKKYLLISGVILTGFMANKAHAGINVTTTPIAYVSVSTTVTLSTTTFTKVSGINSLSNTSAKRTGVKVSNPATNSNTVVCVMSNGSPSSTIGSAPIEIQVGENPVFEIHASLLELYCASLTSAESVNTFDFNN